MYWHELTRDCLRMCQIRTGIRIIKRKIVLIVSMTRALSVNVLGHGMINTTSKLSFLTFVYMNNNNYVTT